MDNKELFEDIKIPDRLSPDNIEKLINDKKDNHTVVNDIPSDSEPKIKENKKHSRIKVSTRIATSLVACAVIAFGITAIVNKNKDNVFEGKDYDFSTNLAITQDYSEVYKTIQRVNSVSDKKRFSISDFFIGIFGGHSKSDATNEDMAQSPEKSDDATDSDYSQTHQQVDGVEEADIVKTDGKYIYYIYNKALVIVKADKGNMDKMSSFDISDGKISEMYLKDNSIILVVSKHKENVQNSIAEEDCYDGCYYNSTEVQIINVEDKASPELYSTYSQNGEYISSRLIKNNLYVSTTQTISGRVNNENEKEQYIPSYSQNDDVCLIRPSDINISKNCENTIYTIVSGLDITKAEPLVSIKAVLGYQGTVYATKDNLYVVGANFSEKKQKSSVMRFSINNGNVEHNGYGMVDGVILNQFSMDEYNGNFRIATTDYNYSNYQVSNGVYVLDDKLQVVGKITGIAKSERIQSARFEKDTGYIVTFRQTDPLYRIDFSNPQKPKITSELKINGYSEYLQSFGEDKLVGIGISCDDNGIRQGVKLTMFSKGTDGEQKEIVSEEIKLTNAITSLQFDHKSCIVDEKKNIIGFPVIAFDGIDMYFGYYLYKYENDKFVSIGKYETHSPDYSNRKESSIERCAYIGDYIYLFSGNSIASFDTEKFVKQDSIEF